MAKYTATITGNTAGTRICTVKKQRGLAEWRALLMAYGTFGGGTVAWNVSPDNGTTLVAMTDLIDTVITMTSNKMYNSSLTTGANNSDLISIWVVVTGSTTPSITVTAYDNS